MRVAALKQITRNWMNVKSPSMNAWKLTLEDIKEMERITYELRNEEDEFIRYWIIWETSLFYMVILGYKSRWETARLGLFKELLRTRYIYIYISYILQYVQSLITHTQTRTKNGLP